MVTSYLTKHIMLRRYSEYSVYLSTCNNNGYKENFKRKFYQELGLESFKQDDSVGKSSISIRSLTSNLRNICLKLFLCPADHTL